MDLGNVTSEIKQQASAHVVELNVNKDKVLPLFNEYWNQVKDIISQDIIRAASKGGYRKPSRNRIIKVAGGDKAFYKPVLADIVQEYFKKQERQALTLNDIDLVEGIASFTIKATVHLEPEVTWKGAVPGIDAPLVVKIPKEPDNFIEKLMEVELLRMQSESAILVPAAEGSVAQDGQVVAVTCMSTIDGKKWEPGCVANKKWPLDKKLIRIPEMYNTLIGMKAEESNKSEYILNDSFDEDVRGKKVEVTIKVHQIYNKETPAIDDDLAKTYGMDNIEALRTSLVNKFTAQVKNDRDNLVFLSAKAQIMNPQIVNVDPVPFIWMAEKARDIYNQSRAMVKTEEDLINTLQQYQLHDGTEITDKRTALAFLAEQSARSLVNDLVLRAWGKRKGVEGDSSLPVLSQYAAMVRAEIAKITTVEVVELETPKE